VTHGDHLTEWMKMRVRLVAVKIISEVMAQTEDQAVAMILMFKYRSSFVRVNMKYI
jgi:hypothetical protein